MQVLLIIYNHEQQQKQTKQLRENTINDYLNEKIIPLIKSEEKCKICKMIIQTKDMKSLMKRTLCISFVYLDGNEK